MNKLWSDVDIKFLKTNYGKMPTKDIGIKLNRSITSIHRKAQKLEITRKNASVNSWTKKDVLILRKWHTKKTCVELAKMVNRTPIGVYSKLKYIGLKPKLMKSVKPWTEQEDKFIIKYRDAPRKYLMEKLGRTNDSISYRKQLLGVTVDIYTNPWTDKELNILKTNMHLKLENLTKLIPTRSTSAISIKASILGLKLYQYKEVAMRGGYKFIRIDGERVAEHRHVMKMHLERDLLPDEVVHHINFDKNLNSIGNIDVCSNNSQHRLAHGSLNKLIQPLLNAKYIQYNRKKLEYEVVE